MSVVTGANGGEVGVWAETEPAIIAEAAKNSVTNLFILFPFGGDIRKYDAALLVLRAGILSSRPFALVYDCETCN